MKSILIFPFSVENDYGRAFAFTIELARHLKADILAVASLNSVYTSEEHIREKKNEIYCKLLEMKGFYHGSYNQWNSFKQVKIQVDIYNKSLSEAIITVLSENLEAYLLLHPGNLAGMGLTEELLSSPPSREITVFMLPASKEFMPPDPDLIGIIFNDQKRKYFRRFLSETKILFLPDEMHEFREQMIIQQAG